MADEDEIQRKRDRLAAETSDYFWHTCPELTARWRQAMLTLPPSVLRDLAVEIQHLEAVTNAANQQLNAAAHPGAVGVVSRWKVSSIAPSRQWRTSARPPR